MDAKNQIDCILVISSNQKSEYCKIGILPLWESENAKSIIYIYKPNFLIRIFLILIFLIRFTRLHLKDNN